MEPNPERPGPIPPVGLLIAGKGLTGDSGSQPGCPDHFPRGGRGIAGRALFLFVGRLVRRLDAGRRGLSRALANGLARGVASQNDAGVTQVVLAVFCSRNSFFTRVLV